MEIVLLSAEELRHALRDGEIAVLGTAAAVALAITGGTRG
jgi:hypothetical protein